MTKVNVRQAVLVVVVCAVVWLTRLLFSLHYAVEVKNWTAWFATVALGLGLPLVAGYQVHRIIVSYQERKRTPRG